MAQQPTSTIQSVPLAVNFGWRGVYSPSSALKDAWAKNVFVEKEVEGPYSVKRPGTNFATSINGLSLSSYVIQGGFSLLGAPMVIAADKVINPYTNIVQASVPYPTGAAGQWYKSFSASVNTSSSTYASPILQSPAGVFTFNNGTGLYSLVTTSQGRYIGFCPGIVELDSSYYAMDTTGLIWSSLPNQPANAWPALNFVTVDAVLTFPLALARHLNYIVAFGTGATQLWYDAGISPGSTLAAVQGGIFLQGMAFNGQFTLAEGNDVLFWMGTSEAGNLCVYALSGLQITKISTPAVERFLESVFPAISSLPSLASQITIRGFTVRGGGHSFYILSQLSPSDTTNLGNTLVFDITTQTWTVWTQQSYYTGNATPGQAGSVLNEGAFRAWGAINGSGLLPYLPDLNNGRGFLFSDIIYQDDSQNINVLIQTDLESWGSQRVKLIPATYLQTDTTPTSLMISWTDNDYQTFSTPQVVSGSNTKKQFIRCGSTIERAWQVTHSDNSPMRFYSVEVEVQAGAL